MNPGGSDVRVLIIGGGPHARVIHDILLEQEGTSVVGFLDANKDNAGKTLQGLPIFGDDSLLCDPEFRRSFDSVIVGMGWRHIAARERIHRRLRELCIPLARAVHPKATVSRSAKIQDGTVVMAGAVINPDASVGEMCVVNTGAMIDHDCRLDAGVFVQPGAVLAGNVSVGKNSMVGLGARVTENVTIGKHSIVGAGALVRHDVEDGTIVVGVPAKRHRDNKVYG